MTTLFITSRKTMLYFFDSPYNRIAINLCLKSSGSVSSNRIPVISPLPVFISLIEQTVFPFLIPIVINVTSLPCGIS